MKFKFDFDVAWDVFEDYRTGRQLPVESKIRTLAKRHSVVIDKIIYDGPGGGNPNIFATATSKRSARAFLTELYGYKPGSDDVKAFVDPCLE